jgi:Ca2+-binding EF-hand superfamily protein
MAAFEDYMRTVGGGAAEGPANPYLEMLARDQKDPSMQKGIEDAKKRKQQKNKKTVLPGSQSAPSLPTIKPIISKDRKDHFEAEEGWVVRRVAAIKDGSKRKGLCGEGKLYVLQERDQNHFKICVEKLKISSMETTMPILTAYVSLKKGGRTMDKVEEEGIPMATKKGDLERGGNFSCLMSGVRWQDVKLWKSVVIVKLATNRPITPFPVVYCFADLNDSQARMARGAGDALHMIRETDFVKRAQIVVSQEGGDSTLSKDAATSVLLKYAATVAKKAFKKIGKTSHDELTFQEFKKMLDDCNIIVLEARAQQLFRTCDLDDSNEIGIGEFEIAIIMNEKLGPSPLESKMHDIFDTFDVDRSGAIDELEYFEAVQALGVTITPEKALAIFLKEDTTGEEALDFEAFGRAYLKVYTRI